MFDEKKAIIFDIQRFSLHDGPGLRTTVFFKGCNLRCIWCQNPESKLSTSEIAFYSERCIGCFQCKTVCSTGSISHRISGKMDNINCNSCGLCAEACFSKSLRIIGKEWTVSQLTEEILRDVDFFTESGGGVTLSGGEPMMNVSFIVELCRILKKNNINIILETAGYFKPELFDSLSGLVDMVYLDIKHSNSNKHLELTGFGNELIIQSFWYLIKNNFNVQPRMPIVPDANDSEDNIRNTAQIIKTAGITSIHCLPYHNLGNSKLSRLNSQQKRFEAVLPSKEKMEIIKNIFKEENISAIIYD